MPKFIGVEDDFIKMKKKFLRVKMTNGFFASHENSDYIIQDHECSCYYG
jgi:hypothetical protein